jgi:RND family efflux transporter MFP subunit
MNVRGFFTGLVLLLVGLGTGGYFLLGKPAPQASTMSLPPVPVVNVIEVVPGKQILTVKTQGTVQPRREINLVAQVGGKIEAVAGIFAAGGFFSEGDVLVSVEQQDYKFAYTRASAMVADARQLLALEQGRARQASREWRELKDREANDLFLRKPQLASAEASLAAAIAEKGQAELSLQRTRVTAPFDGRIMQTQVDLGQYVAAGTPIARIHATDAVEVRLPLTDAQLALLNLSLHYRDEDESRPPTPVNLSGRFAGSIWHWQGVVVRTDASIDSRSRVLYVVVEVADPFASDLKSERTPLILGQFVQAEIPGRELDNALMVPRHTLRHGSTLWLVDGDDRLQIAPVRVLQYGDQFIIVQGDFSGPIRVVTSSLGLALPGMRVAARVDDDTGQAVN